MVCHSCKADVKPERPRTSWKVAVVAFWVAAMVTSTVFSLLLGLNLVLVPAWFGIGISVGVAARRAAAWTCPRCHEEMFEPARADEVPPPPVLAPRPLAEAPV